MLKAMGYCARVMPKGPDGGRDVVASPDALGLESPRIVAEAKHRKGAMGAPAVRSFIGGLRAGDRGLYVSTGGFTKEARLRPTAPTPPYACSTWMPSCVITSTSTTRPMTTPAPSFRLRASGGRRKGGGWMAMTEIEKGRFPRLFNRGSYVLNFTTDFSHAFKKSDVDIASRADNASRRETAYCPCRERRPF